MSVYIITDTFNVILKNEAKTCLQYNKIMKIDTSNKLTSTTSIVDDKNETYEM